VTAARPAVTITGIGLVTPVGRKVDDVFDALCADRSGLRTPTEVHSATTFAFGGHNITLLFGPSSISRG
jgi:3-oxoacyl-(acyl-carrier-protein) synthase